MLTPQEVQTFEVVARNHPQLTAILNKFLDEQKEILVKVADVEQLRRAQGQAQCLAKLIGHLEHHKSTRKGPST